MSFANVDDTLDRRRSTGSTTEIEFENSIGTPPDLADRASASSNTGFRSFAIAIVAIDRESHDCATSTSIATVYYCERQSRTSVSRDQDLEGARRSHLLHAGR